MTIGGGYRAPRSTGPGQTTTLSENGSMIVTIRRVNAGGDPE